jgi:hypothetical protein
LRKVARRHDATPARVALSWVLGRTAVSRIIAARKTEQLEDNIRAVDLLLSDDDVSLLDAASDPGVLYPKWMVLQLDTAEDPRSKVLYPERYANGGPWKGPPQDPVISLRKLYCPHDICHMDASLIFTEAENTLLKRFAVWARMRLVRAIGQPWKGVPWKTP